MPEQAVCVFDLDHTLVNSPLDLRAVGREDGSDQLLVGAEAVKRRGVEQRDAAVERRAQDRLGDVPRRRRGVGMAEIHAPQPEGRHAEWAETT